MVKQATACGNNAVSHRNASRSPVTINEQISTCRQGEGERRDAARARAQSARQRKAEAKASHGERGVR